MTKISNLLIVGAICLAIPACDPSSGTEPAAQSNANASEVETNTNTERTGETLAYELAESKEDPCAVAVGSCLAGTYVCLQENDDATCTPGFDACRNDIVADSCASDDGIDIGVNSALRCWNQFDDCAASDADGGTCATALSACIQKGSLCEINAETECDADLCDAETCEAAYWRPRGRRGRRGDDPGRPGGGTKGFPAGNKFPGSFWPRPGNSWPRPGSSWPRPGGSSWPRPGGWWPRPGGWPWGWSRWP